MKTNGETGVQSGSSSRPRKSTSDQLSASKSNSMSASNIDTSKMAVVKNSDIGMLAPKPILFLLLWYFFSGLTLFFNKYIVAIMNGSESLLSCTQMLCTLGGGYFQMYYPLKMFEKTPERKQLPQSFHRNMMIVGSLRYTTVLLGMFALDYLEISFTETVKSTAPAFTVIISRMLLGEITGYYVKLSLIPVMGGLALCSANELSFHLIGFFAALGTNISECLQNVYSKMLISGQSHQYSPAELQYYTSLYSLVIQIPCLIFLIDWGSVLSIFNGEDDESAQLSTLVHMAFLYLINGIFFHFQTITAYVLMDFISPVTHSVANTGKRALLIWLSVLLFGNPVTFLSGLGTLVVIIGVLVYNKATEIDNRLKKKGLPINC